MLLTGFQSYGARAINPAEEIVKRLDGETIGGERVEGRVLPVDYAKLGPSIRKAIAGDDAERRHLSRSLAGHANDQVRAGCCERRRF